MQLNVQYRLLVPVEYKGLTQFAPYSQVEYGVSQFYLDGNVTVSPKTVYLPQSEAMYKFSAQGKKLAIEEESCANTPFTIDFGSPTPTLLIKSASSSLPIFLLVTTL